MTTSLKYPSSATRNANPFRFESHHSQQRLVTGSNRLLGFTEKLLGLDQLAHTYASFKPSGTPDSFAAKVLAHFNID